MSALLSSRTAPRCSKYTFICPVCQKLVVLDRKAEPCCTGPSESRDDHEMEVMRLLRIDAVNVSPVAAEKSATGPLIILPD